MTEREFIPFEEKSPDEQAHHHERTNPQDEKPEGFIEDSLEAHHRAAAEDPYQTIRANALKIGFPDGDPIASLEAKANTAGDEVGKNYTDIVAPIKVAETMADLISNIKKEGWRGNLTLKLPKFNNYERSVEQEDRLSINKTEPWSQSNEKFGKILLPPEQTDYLMKLLGVAEKGERRREYENEEGKHYTLSLSTQIPGLYFFQECNIPDGKKEPVILSREFFYRQPHEKN
ncbi:MAG: hypothetical protein WCP91_00980 [Candidatus Berkelbacteria bacterium]